MKSDGKKAIFAAIAAAALYALNSPLSKLLLDNISSVMMAGLLYTGAGTGLVILRLAEKSLGIKSKEKRLEKKDIPYTAAMVLLDIAAPICLMFGLKLTTAANASLLNNFEIAATSLIAFVIFREKISKRLWGAIALVTLASIILSVEDAGSFSFSYGSLLVLLACFFWGMENNCTGKISDKDPIEITTIKGFGSGAGSVIIALIKGESFPQAKYIIAAMILGFVAYGLSISLYIYAQRTLGAAKTSAYYAVSPFIGAAMSLIIFRQLPSLSFIAAIIIMAAGTYLASTDQIKA